MGFNISCSRCNKDLDVLRGLMQSSQHNYMKVAVYGSRNLKGKQC